MLDSLKVRADKLTANPSSSNVIKVVQEIVLVLEAIVSKKKKEINIEQEIPVVNPEPAVKTRRRAGRKNS